MISLVHIVFSLEPGGMENGVVNSVNRLDRSRFAPSILCLRKRGAFADRVHAGVPCEVLGFPDRFTPWGIVRLAGALRRSRPAVIHTHNLGPLLYAVPALRLAGIPARLVHGEHSALTESDRSPRRLRQRRWFYRAAWAVQTVSHGLAEDLRLHGLTAARMRVVVNGVDTTRFRPDPVARQSVRAGFGIPADARVVGIVGRFGAFKRHDFLLAAFSALAPMHPDLHLLLVGDGGPRAVEVRARVDADPNRARIHLAGFQADPAPFYAAMDLLAVPSVNEGLSNALLEALASGVPVLTHPACGAAEAIRDGRGGWAVPLETPAELAAELARKLADRAGLERAGAEARAVAL